VLSQRLCGDCHAVEASADQSPKSKAPTFAKIADTPGMTGMALSAWLHSSHRTMPLVRLDTRTREDISAYILSLKPAAAQG
jgi:mono/diheme cytochrome c family protein